MDDLADVILDAMHEHSTLLFEYAAGARDKPPPEVQHAIAARVREALLSDASVERVARHLIRKRGADIVASDIHWPDTASQYWRRVAEDQSYADARSLITDAFRDARQAIEALVGAEETR